MGGAKHNRFYEASEDFFNRTDRVLRTRTCSLSCGTRRRRCWSPSGTLVLTIVLFYYVPKGFFPVQDTGVILGISDAGQTISFTDMAERQQALAAVILKDPDVVSLSSFIGVDGTNMTPNSGRIQINLKPRERAKRVGDRHYPPAAASTGAGGRDHAVHAAGAGPQHRGPREPHAISIFDRGC